MPLLVAKQVKGPLETSLAQSVVGKGQETEAARCEKEIGGVPGPGSATPLEKLL